MAIRPSPQFPTQRNASINQGRFELIREAPGSAEGRCLVCGAVIALYVPKENLAAVEKLTEAFGEHYQQKHGDDHLVVFPVSVS